MLITGIPSAVNNIIMADRSSANRRSFGLTRFTPAWSCGRPMGAAVLTGGVIAIGLRAARAGAASGISIQSCAGALPRRDR
eukprot:scaffold2610_cov301-Prasinococcus_capsulatus_cf.AAC.6